MRYVYLHGFASGPSSSKAQYFREQFARNGLELEVPELVPGAFEEITVSGQMEVIGELLRGEPARLIGSSMGGYLAALYAARHEEVDRIALLAPAFGLAHRWLESLPAEKVREWRETGRLLFYHYVQQREAPVNYRLIEDGLQYEPEPAVAAPVLIFHGRKDDVVPCILSERYAQNKPNVELHLLDSDHQLTDQVVPMCGRTLEFFREGGV